MSSITLPAKTDEVGPEDFDDPMELAEHIGDLYGVPWSFLERLGGLIAVAHTNYVDAAAEDIRLQLSIAESELDDMVCFLGNPLEK